jgi:hypothetical protein
MKPNVWCIWCCKVIAGREQRKGVPCAQVCFSTALFGFVSEMQHEQWFLFSCLVLRAIMGEACSMFKHGCSVCTCNLNRMLKEHCVAKVGY